MALACYPPFNGLSNKMLGWSASIFPHFENPVVHVTMASLLLVLMAIYASASVALNLKASNLTHRGIIDEVLTASSAIRHTCARTSPGG